MSPVSPRARRLALTTIFWVGLAGVVSGAAMWLIANLAALLSLHAPPVSGLSAGRAASLRLLLRHEWTDPARAFPHAGERDGLPGPIWFLIAVVLLAALLAVVAGAFWHKARVWGTGSPLGQTGVRRWLHDRAYLPARTWAQSGDLRRLWVPGPVQGRPYVGWTAGRPPRMLAAEAEVQLTVIAPPRSGKSSGYVIPWLLDHRGPALVLSTKRDVHHATIEHRRKLGRVWFYDPFGEAPTCAFTPLSNASTWEQALRTSGSLAGAARSDQETAASEFWDREASMLLAPLMHAAALTGQSMATVLEWLDTRDFARAEADLRDAGADAACAQATSVLARDPRNRETTIMSAANLLRAYRYPRVTRNQDEELTPDAFLDGRPNTIYVVAASHHQRELQPVILALVSAIYETAIERSRQHGPFDPPLYLLLDEAANIAPIRDIAPWLSQCGDHGITIATIWQSIAQIEHRYGKAERDAILAASTAQIFIPPIADPTTTSYISDLLGHEPVAQASRKHGLHAEETIGVSQQRVVESQWLRQVARGNALLVYRDLPPAIVNAPGWYERDDIVNAAIAGRPEIDAVFPDPRQPPCHLLQWRP